MARKVSEWILIAAGLICLGFVGFSTLHYRLFQERALGTTPLVSSSLVRNGNNGPSVIGQLTVRRLGLSVAMVEGVDEQSLAIAAGHMPGTPLAGQLGNVVVAGHRDTAFWPLRNIRLGDLIQVKGRSASTYRVVTTKVVDPDDTASLANRNNPILTLVTCYPFRYVGPAPKRFIVQANLVR